MLSWQIEQEERRRVLREQDRPSSMMDHYTNEVGGRFTAEGAATVVGRDNPHPYPAASPSWQIQLPDEPPLGLDNPTLEPASPALPEALATGPTSAAPSLPVQRKVGSLSQSTYRRA
jgi:hypothetical protein